MVFSLDVPTAVERIRARNERLGAFVSTRLDDALADASRLADERPRGPLHGIPYGLKDEWETADLPTTGGSYRHRERNVNKTSSVRSVFDDAGAVLVGKTNLSDMGLAPEATSYVGGAARNPYDEARTAGGSSGGAAVAVADGMEAFDWGTDIGGSIRMPAAFCGVYGMRLSSETWPIEDLFPTVPKPLDWMCGQGPLTQTLDQMRAVLDVAAPRLRKGPPRAFTPRGVYVYTPDVTGKWPTFEGDVAAVFEGADTNHGLPSTTEIRKCYGALWASHFDSLIDSDDSLTLSQGTRAVLSSVVFRGAFGDRRMHPTSAELLLLITLGRYTIFRDATKALDHARRVRDAFDAAWQDHIIVAPVCCYPAPKVGKTNRNLNLLSCTFPGNVADATGLSVPFGTFEDGMPRAIQLMGPPGSEHVLIDLAERLRL